MTCGQCDWCAYQEYSAYGDECALQMSPQECDGPYEREEEEDDSLSAGWPQCRDQ